MSETRLGTLVERAEAICRDYSLSEVRRWKEQGSEQEGQLPAP